MGSLPTRQKSSPRTYFAPNILPINLHHDVFRCWDIWAATRSSSQKQSTATIRSNDVVFAHSDYRKRGNKKTISLRNGTIVPLIVGALLGTQRAAPTGFSLVSW